MYQVINHQLQEVEQMEQTGVLFVDQNQIEQIKGSKQYALFMKERENLHFRFENHLYFDLIVLPSLYKEAENTLLYVFLEKETVLFVGDISYFRSLIKHAPMLEGTIPASMILQLAFRNITEAIHEQVETFENEILQTEDHIIKKTALKNVSQAILNFRKRLLVRKRDVNELLDILDCLLENERNLFQQDDLTRLDIEKNRLNRNHDHLLSLLEYVTEVREAYQSAIDNQLNNIMQLFTIISAIFLPLTLIVGWYGMNLQMPETSWEHMYFLVIFVCVGIVAFCVYFFRKNKWF